MASQDWLPKEVQSLRSQTSASSSTLGEPSLGLSASPAGAAPVVVTASKETTSSMSEPVREPAQKKHATPAYGVIRPSFSYMNVNASSESSLQSSLSPAIHSGSPICASALQPPVPGQSRGGPSFSYIAHASAGLSSSQQFTSPKPLAPGHSLQGKTASSPDASLQPPVQLQSVRPSMFISRTGPQITAPPGPLPPSLSQGVSVSRANLSFYGNSESMQIDPSKSNTRADVSETEEAIPSTPSATQSISQPYAPATLSLQVSQAMPRTPMVLGTPGSAPATSLPSNMTNPSTPADSTLFTRPVMPVAPTVSNHLVQPQACGPYPSVPFMAGAQGPWLQPPPISGIVRSPYSPYPPAAYTGPFPMAARGMPLPSASWPETHPPGVTPVRASLGIPSSSTGAGGQMTVDSGMRPDLPPGIDDSKHTNDVEKKDCSLTSEQVDTWTAHRTETGAIYYYNALTGESTYEKPAGFKGEPDYVTTQPTPISWEKLAGTDWALVATNDGKRYYYNTKTKLSSWQIPREVMESKKQQDSGALSEQSMSVPTTSMLTEKASASVTLNAPAVNTGGRDATPLRPLGVPGSSSALDLIKKKLQDSSAPATTSPGPTLPGASEVNASKTVDTATKGPQNEKNRDNTKDSNIGGNVSESSSDSEDEEKGPTTEECILQFKEMLKERGVAPFSKWEKELPKIVFDPRFKAISSHSARRALFEHYVRTRAEDERKEKRAALKAAGEAFKQLLDEAKEDIDHNTDYQTFKKKWGHDQRFEALDRKERETLLNERVLPLKRAAEERAQAELAAARSSFKSMLRERGDITSESRWSKVKDSLRSDPRYKLVKREEREAIFGEYLSELIAGEDGIERMTKAKLDEEEKLKERERALRKRKEREEQEVERVRLKALRKEAVECYQALLVEVIKDPQASWTESKPKLEKDPQRRAANPYLDQSDLEKLFREHVKILHERVAQEFRALLAKVVTVDAAAQETEGCKTVLNSWSTAKRLLKDDPRYSKMPRKDRELLWQRHIEDILRRQKSVNDQGAEKQKEVRRGSVDSGRYLSRSSRTEERR